MARAHGFGTAEHFRYNEWYADSYERTIGTPDHPIFVWERDLENIVAFKVISATIPFSYYVINTTNNTFLLTEASPPGTGLPITITIPPGNYTATSLAAALETALDNSAGVGDYTVTFDPVTLKFTISVTPAFVFTLTFGTPLTDPGTTNPRLWLGFVAGDNTSSAGGVLEAPNVAHVSGPDYLLICSNRLGLLNNETLRRGGFAQSGPIIAQIPVNTNPGGIILYEDPDPEKYFEVDAHVVTEADLYVAWGTQDGGLFELAFNGLSFTVKMAFITNDMVSVKRSAGVQIGGRAKRLMISE